MAASDPPAVIPCAVRILPMWENEFEDQCPNTTHEWVQARWFLGQMVDSENCGRYCYHSQGMIEEAGAVVLFQFKSRIVASATFLRRESYEQPMDGVYHGAFWFDPCSIRIFEPIDEATIQSVWEGVTFSQVKHHLEANRYPQFLHLLRGVAAPVLPDQ